MATDKDKTQRRVYVLPNELVERIVAYQNAMGYSSEVEAARRLLDDALKHGEDSWAITKRFQERLKETRVMADIAKDVLVGHPLVSNIGMKPGSIDFTLTSGESVSISQDGSAQLNRRGEIVNIDKDGKDISIPF